MRWPLQKRARQPEVRSEGIGTVCCPGCSCWMVARSLRIKCPDCGLEFDAAGQP
jgi:hypothetical protein